MSEGNRCAAPSTIITILTNGNLRRVSRRPGSWTALDSPTFLSFLLCATFRLPEKRKKCLGESRVKGRPNFPLVFPSGSTDGGFLLENPKTSVTAGTLKDISLGSDSPPFHINLWTNRFVAKPPKVNDGNGGDVLRVLGSVVRSSGTPMG